MTCPRPDKRRYFTEDEAWRAAHHHHQNLGQLTVRPYVCPCGVWHLGHFRGSFKDLPPRERKRIRKGAPRR